MQDLIIGLSYAPFENLKYRNYWNALRKAAQSLDREIEIVELFEHPDRVQFVDGIVFTGGSDVAPSRYGKPSERGLCGDIDDVRDSAEFHLADVIQKRGIPVLGICRGMQLLNVHRGGTLITDLLKSGANDHTKLDPDTDRRHPIDLVANSYLRKIVNRRTSEVNSAHHQAVEHLGDGFAVSARSETDNVIEAIEWADMTGKPFFLAVQWHPERMDYDEPCSGRILEAFAWEVAAHKLLQPRIGEVDLTPMQDDASSTITSENGQQG